MSQGALPLCHYPTTVVFVDDSRPFLDSLPLKLSDRIVYRVFDDPHAALDYIEAHEGRNPLAPERCLEPAGPADWALRLRVEGLLEKAEDRFRFQEPSVLVVDFRMPGVDGLAVCRRLAGRPLRKVLLTGVADEKVGVEALNERVIDYYLHKRGRTVFERLNALLPLLQERYFAAWSQAALPGVRLVAPFLDDPVFLDWFARLRRRLDIVEYYLRPAPPGFRLIDADGRRHELLVYSAEDLAAQREIAEDYGAPPALVEALARGDRLPYFHQRADGCYHEDIEDWEACLHPAEALAGRQTYRVALAPSPHDGAPAFGLNTYLRGVGRRR